MAWDTRMPGELSLADFKLTLGADPIQLAVLEKLLVYYQSERYDPYFSQVDAHALQDEGIIQVYWDDEWRRLFARPNKGFTWEAVRVFIARGNEVLRRIRGPRTVCPDCHGRGWTATAGHQCTSCRGTGELP